jgi:acetoacetyl-CoA synthetase
MPVGFWNDPDGQKYHDAYFSRYSAQKPDGVWAHGDYAERVAHHGKDSGETAGLVIHGRSDAVLNPGGVRIGTAEIYRQVEQLDEVLESLAIGQPWAGDVRVVLFVVLNNGQTLDDALRDKIRSQIRSHCTPRHVPAKIIQVAELPRTISGKLVELAVRNVVQGLPVNNTDALKNPEALQYFRDLEELQHD